MAEVPIYRSQVGAPNIGSLSIAPVQVPDLHSGEGLSQGAQELGAALMRYAAFKKNAEDETRSATAMNGFITGLDQAKTDAAQNPNYETAPGDFRTKAEELKRQALDAANLAPADRAKFELQLTEHILPAAGTVTTAALGKHVDAASAARGELALKLASKAAFAQSDSEAAAMSRQYYERLQSDQASGLIAADVAEKAKQDFDASVAEQRITRMIRERPLDAVKTLADPNQVQGMDPSRREQFRNAAAAAADELQKFDLIREASGSTPFKVSLRLNKALSPQHADDIYYKGILQIGGEAGGKRNVAGKSFLNTLIGFESGGRNIPNVTQGTSSGQAQGFFQITTGTWKEFAGRAGVDLGKYPNALAAPYAVQAQIAGIIPLGRWDPKTLAVLRRAGYSVNPGATLAANVAANGGSLGAGGSPDEAGLGRWRSNLAALDNNIALAAAAQVSSLDKAKEYQAEAVKQFGPDATPLEIATIIGDKPTHDYVMQLFGYMAVPPTGSGVTPGARFQTETAVRSVVDKQQAEQERIIKELAGLQRATGGDDFLEQLKQGHAVWTPEFNTVYQTQKQAAAYGSTEAAGFVHKVDTGVEAQPHTAAAWQMTPPQLDNAIARLDAAAVAAPASHADIVQLAAYRAVRGEIGDKYKTDTIGLGQRAGLFAPEPLDPQAAPDDPTFRRALAVRGGQAIMAASLYGPVLPLRPDDVAGLKDRFANANAQEKGALLDAFANALTPRVYNAAITQLGLDAATAAAGRFAVKAPELMHKALDGAAILAAPGYEKGAAALATAAADTIPSGLYPPGTRQLADVMQLVPAVYAANRRRDATMFEKPDAGELGKTVEEVVGPLVTIGGRETAAWPNVGGTQFETLWDGFSNAQLAAAGGAHDGAGRAVTAEDLTAHAVLTQLEPRGSEYFVSMPSPSSADGLVPYFRKDGKPLVIDFAALAKDYAEHARAQPPAPVFPIVTPAAPPPPTTLEQALPVPPPRPPEPPPAPGIEPPAPGVPPPPRVLQ